METSEKFWSQLVHGIEDMKKGYRGEPLAICASPKTVEQLKSQAKELTATGIDGATICGIEVFALEEYPDDRISIHPLAWIQEMLKHRVAWLEWLRHG